MPPHKQLEALIRAAARYFNVEPDQLRAPGGRYLPLVQFRQLTQLVAYDHGHSCYAITKAFDYADPRGSRVSRNVMTARNHISNGQRWWAETKAALEQAWDEELG